MIEELKNLDLHDTPIKSIEIDFDKAILTFKVSQHDDKAMDFFEIEMRFVKVSNFHLDEIPDITIVEILNMNIGITSENSQYVEFLLAYDYPFALLKFSFEFGDVEVIYPSNRTPHTI